MSFRATLVIVVSVFALLLGALFALPVYKKEYAKVEIKGVSLLVEVARDSQSRARGLAGRDKIPAQGGMLFVFDQPAAYGIWMKDMKIPIDIFWIKNGVVVDLEENVIPFKSGLRDTSPPIFRPDVTALYVLETSAGLAQKHGIKIGDEIKTFFRNEFAQIASPTAVAVEEPPPVGGEYFIETLRLAPAEGGEFKIKKLLTKNKFYRKFAISYKSGKFAVSGVMNVPMGAIPRGGFPVLILNHGLISPEIYYTGRGSRREQDFFARQGYITIHPDYRGLGETDPKLVCPSTLSYTKDGCHHDFYVGYTDDLVNLVDALKKLNSKLIDVKRMGMWGHSMGGGMAARVMVLNPDIRAYVLFAPISADVEDNFYELKSKEITWLRETYGMGSEVYKKMSPLTYFAEVQAPVQLHHASTDKDVPVEFSEKMYEALKNSGKKVEFYKYPGEGHEFGDAWSLAAERALQFFDKYVKGAR
ncbi:MAG: alpha/beta fold hydrolase [Candidatus Sungiibacteriota bacterium]|uniref:Alpha/beta fold hydrolase n=1 Tax=Candidatus Sungiibacteriota bacterium TaxID=2750080 RepID=A0A7T5RIT0_9BACT|nr:MAG: alpha/beta fold hydrolase [Candidatus Sungbacteria bacterium]